MKKNIILYIIIVILAVSTLYANIRIIDLEDAIQNARNYTENESISIRNSINTIYNNVDEMLKKEASLLSSLNYTYGEINTDNHTITVSVELTPKEIIENMTVQLQYKNEIYNLIYTNNQFKGDVPIGFFASEDIFLIIKHEDIVKTQLLEDIETHFLYQNYLPYLNADMSAEATSSDTKTTIHLDSMIIFPSIHEKILLNFETFSLVTEINGNEETRKNITSTIKANDSFSDGHVFLEDELTYNATKDDQIIVYIEAEDELGYIHRVPLFMQSVVEWEAMGSVDRLIYDQEGNLLNG